VCCKERKEGRKEGRKQNVEERRKELIDARELVLIFESDLSPLPERALQIRSQDPHPFRTYPIVLKRNSVTKDGSFLSW
jgi:hypothetical protein